MDKSQRIHPRSAISWRWTLLLIAALVLLWQSPHDTAHAAVITVDTTADELLVDGNCSLREAITAANTDSPVDACPAGSGADSIVLSAGTYAITIPGRGEDANLTGDFDIIGDLSITGAGAASTIIDAGALDRGIDIRGATITVTIFGVTVQNGAPNSIDGGGLIIPGRSNVTLTGVIISGNSDGGGIWNRGTLMLIDSTVSGNSGLTGGIVSWNTLTLTNSTVDANSGAQVGGVFNFYGTVGITNSTVSHNSSGQAGGGILNLGELTVANSTVSANSAVNGGGGIYNNSTDSTVIITSSTLSGNSAFFGGGLANPVAGPTTLKNTIVANSTSVIGGDCDGPASVTSLGHNLASDNSCGFFSAGDLNNTNPLLGPLVDNGGPTETQALLAGSPAIDAGSADCPPPLTDQRGMARPQDGDGNASTVCDIGAFEADAIATPTPAPATNTATGTATATTIATQTPLATPTVPRQSKGCDPAGAPGNNVNYATPAAGPACNLFICVAPNSYQNCANPNEGHLTVVEHVDTVTTAAGIGIGAYEFQVEFDSFVIQSVNPTDIIFTYGSTTSTPPFAALGRGAPTCNMSITFENSVRFGCVTAGQNQGANGSFDLAKLDLVPAADDVKHLFPGNDNGIPTLIKDNQCELADILGHPLPGSVNTAGQLTACGDIYVTVRILEGDINLDCRVNVDDEALIAAHYGAFFGSAFYHKWFDLEPRFHDLDIDIKDVQKVFGRDGSICQDPLPAQTPVSPPLPLNS